VRARFLAVSLAFAGAATMSACATIGPDFVAPEAPDVDRYTATPLPARTASASAAGAEAQTFQIGANVPGRWWTLFSSSALNAFVDEALAANPSLASAQQSLIQAQENYAANQSNAFLPDVAVPTLQATATNQGPFTVTTQGALRVGYAIDVCCGAGRQRESQQASLLRQEVSLQAAYLSLTANVVNTVIGLALLEERIAATQQILALQRELAEITERRLALGDIAPADAAAQDTQIANTEASLVSLQRQRAQQTNQLAIYLGRFPSEMPAINIDLGDLTLPTQIPVSLPSQLVTQRPDIVQATYSLQAATADVGVTLASMLPQISITGSFTPAGAVTSLAVSIVQSAINLGANIHRTRATEAALQAAAEDYQSTVIAAFVDVANALNSITYDAQLMALQVESERASRNSLELARQQYEVGAVPYSTVLSAEQSYRSAVTSLLSARADRLTDTVALYVALGGGWWQGA
jgi:NodT family efflux transporter outer membrane factor (OMF) lipoprotein